MAYLIIKTVLFLKRDFNCLASTSNWDEYGLPGPHPAYLPIGKHWFGEQGDAEGPLHAEVGDVAVGVAAHGSVENLVQFPAPQFH